MFKVFVKKLLYFFAFSEVPNGIAYFSYFLLKIIYDKTTSAGLNN